MGKATFGKIALKTANLTKKFGDILAIDNLDLEVLKGETFGLIGPNGAGKTTTIRILNCIISPTYGNAFVNGISILERPDDVKQICGLLPETPGVFEKLSAEEFLDFIGALYKVPSETRKSRIDELFDLFGLQGRRNDLLEGYSRGMKQRILLAATLVHDPEILFLDEPTSFLDPQASRMVKDLIKMMAEKARKTMFICTHILEIAEEICDRIGIIAEGRLVATGTPGELMKQTGTSRLEDAFIEITGGKIPIDELLAWRE
ncbi:MAG: ABC transporter ATP-binding protein [Candidatus Hodarchaeota archaeon]